jgi:hypothetical protein
MAGEVDLAKGALAYKFPESIVADVGEVFGGELSGGSQICVEMGGERNLLEEFRIRVRKLQQRVSATYPGHAV